MIRFEAFPFTIHPKNDGDYIVMRPNGYFDAFSFTTKHGWNTSAGDDGSYSYSFGMSDEEMQNRFKGWLKPYEISSCNWFDTIETMIEEIRQRLLTYADRELTESEEDTEYNLEELYGYLYEAKDFAESFK